MPHENYMRLAIELAADGARRGEVPVGCVVAGPDGSVIGCGYNLRESTSDATAHAELIAISSACAVLGDWRLDNCTIYVTLEPCPMCAGAIINARIPVLVFAAREPVTGSSGSVIDIFAENFPHRPKVYAGVLEKESLTLLRQFFKTLRP